LIAVELDFLIINGTVYDGLGGPPREVSVGIKKRRIVLDKLDTTTVTFATTQAKEVINAKGLAIAPGFIDTHSHSEFTVLADPWQEGKLFQGITTEINGNCGLSAAPLYGEYLAHRMDDLKEYDIPYRWNTLKEYFFILESLKPSINFATLVGHGNIRGSVMGFSDRIPSEEEIKRLCYLIEQSIEDGAIGLSTGLIYPPGIYSSTEELIKLTSHGARFSSSMNLPFIYTSHMRSESDKLIESIEEVISVAEGSTSPVHISHIKTAGRNNWNKIEKVLELIYDARKRGINITADRYPYTASSTDLDSILPAWAFEGGKEREIERLRDPRTARKIKKILAGGNGIEDIVISSVESPSRKWMEGKTLKEISAELKKDVLDFIIELLIEERLRVGAIFHSMSEENLKRFLREPWIMIGTDSSSRSFNGPTRKGKPHPRGFGSMPRFLGYYVRDEGLLSLEEAIKRLTYLPAKTFGLKERGIIKNGAFADIVIFDPERIVDRADFSNPFLKPDGIRYVFVNGLPAIRDGEPTGIRNGAILRNGR